MKQFTNYLALAITLVVAACSSNDDSVSSKIPGAGQVINFDVNVVGETMVTKAAESSSLLSTSFPTGTEISVSNGKGMASTLKFDGTNWNYVSSNKQYFDMDGSNATIYATYPKLENLISSYADVPSISNFEEQGFSCQSDQSTTDNYNKSDLISYTGTVSPTTSKVSITMEHKCAKIVLKLLASSNWSKQATVKIKNVYIRAVVVYNSGILDLGSAWGDKPDVIMGTDVMMYQLTNDGVSAIIVPQTFTQGDQLFEITSGSKTYKYFYNSSGLEFKAGHVYTFTLEDTSNTIKSGTVSITGWDNEDGGTSLNYSGSLTTN